jgi:uncharacterized membrane protein YhaH (DUF805 family)
MEPPRLLFGFNGRTNRLAYWPSSGFAFVYGLLVCTLAILARSQPGTITFTRATGSRAEGASPMLFGMFAGLVLSLVADVCGPRMGSLSR